MDQGIRRFHIKFRCLAFSLTKEKNWHHCTHFFQHGSSPGNEKWWPWVEKLWLPQSRAAPSSDVKPCSCRQLTVLWDQPRKLFRVEFCFCFFFFLIERCQKHDPSHLEIHPSIPSVNTWVLFCAKHRARSCLHNAGGGGGEQAGGVNQMRPSAFSACTHSFYVHIHRYWRLCPSSSPCSNAAEVELSASLLLSDKFTCLVT